MPEDRRIVETVSAKTVEILNNAKKEGNSKKSVIDGAITFYHYMFSNEGTLKDNACEVQVLRVLERQLSNAVKDGAPTSVIQALNASIEYQRQVIANLKEPKKDGK